MTKQQVRMGVAATLYVQRGMVHMKILQINSWFSQGGPPRVVNGIYDTLKEFGYECKIAAARGRVYKPEDSIIIGGRYAPYINALSCRLFDDDGFRSKHATHALVEEIKKYDPDIIHLHNLHSYYLNIEILFDYLKTSGKKIFWTLHDCWAFTGHCAHFSVAGCYKWETQCYNCPQKRSFPACLVHSNAKENFERKKRAFTGVPHMTILTPSLWLSNLVKKSFLSEYPIEVVYNKIDTNKFRPLQSDIKERLGIDNKKLVLGVAMNWHGRKGFDDFLKLRKTLGNEYIIAMVGVDEPQRKKLPDGIIGIQRTQSIDELAELYSAAEVFVNPSREETFGLTTAEALACGTPAIVYKGTACEEIIANTNQGVCGALIETGDIECLANAVKSLKKDSAACLKRAHYFSRWDHKLEYVELYEGKRELI